MRAARTGHYPDDDTDIADLIVSLTAHRLRDAMLAPDHPADGVAAENLAYFLWPLSNDPYASRLAAYIAALAYQRGAVTYARAALNAATTDDTFTQLLDLAIRLVIPAENLHQLCWRSAQNTRSRLRPDPA